MITVRAVTSDDMPMLTGWAEKRGCALIPGLLSPHGFMAEQDGAPVMVIWGFMILDVPVIQLDHLCARPKTSIRTVRAAWDALLSAIRAWIKLINDRSSLGYSLIHCIFDERLVREAARSGGHVISPKQFTALFHV